ncbi:MAG TPA: 4-hydroxy-3-methylbut-2-enyl diphosphate reductase [bacterium]|nr:4-hydroxy-3-methylbut-2-enyl diphosphate reductase [Dictyoglomota bacterium]HON72074.1 4-hydroxy-3-methylbut-2-enyl diphosphate reductase [bacterium]
MAEYHILLAREYGFCFGVKRAIKLAEETIRSGIKIASLGPIIHNPLEVERLKNMGLRVIGGIEELGPDESLLIRSHGIPLDLLNEIKRKNINIIDATCPLVARAQHMVEFLFSEGYKIIIIGEDGHPEVKGLVSYGGGNISVVSSPEAIPDITPNDKLGIVGQTTYPVDKFVEIVKEITGRGWEIRVFNTLCDASRKRQGAVKELADQTDVIIVIGGKNSANTRRLVDIAESEGVDVYHIETWDELRSNWFLNKEKIGVTAGASTPEWVIENVLEKIKELCSQ